MPEAASHLDPAGRSPGLSALRRDAMLRLLEAGLAVLLLGWLLVGTAFPDLVLRSLKATLPAFAALAGLAGFALLRTGLRLRCEPPYLALYVVLGCGLISVWLSWIGFPALAEYPRSERFIVRQAYFIALLPVALAAGPVFWRHLYGPLAAISIRHFLPLTVTLILADWITAKYWGDELFAQFNDYNLYLEKGTIWLIFGFVYMTRVAASRGFPLMPLTVLVVYYAGSQIVSYGSLFQATTGDLVFVTLLAATFLARRPLYCAWAMVGLFVALTGLLVVGTIAPEIFRPDINAYWRFSGWNANFHALYETGFLGVGFGTPYLPATTETLEHALRVLKRGHEPWSMEGAPYDLIYLRAQHNSFVNLFFRIGLIGGLAFFLFNAGLLVAGLLRIAHADRATGAQLTLAMPLFLIGVLQIALHVGLETPRFLITYVLAAALLSVFLYGSRRAA